MLRTLIVGFGRAGRELHVPGLSSARAAAAGEPLFDPAPPLVVDPRTTGDGAAVPVVRPGSIAEASRALDPERTVVHLCTPPAVRSALLRELAGLGFRKLIVEKPLATGHAELDRIVALAGERSLELVVVGNWLASGLVERLRERLDRGGLGALRHLEIVQHKPRFDRTLRGGGDHPTAFDVEVPHSLGLALHLAGDARLVRAGCADMMVGERVVPWMGRASLVLRHRGSTTRIFSDLTAPVRERRAMLRLERGRLVARFPVSSSDHHAQLATYDHHGRLVERQVFADDSMARLFAGAYRWFAGRGGRPASDLALNRRVVTLLCEAKERCGAARPETSETETRTGAHRRVDTLL